MKALWGTAAVGAVFAHASFADTLYDRRLEQAAIAIVADKMGGLRGGFAFNAKPKFDPPSADAPSSNQANPAGPGTRPLVDPLTPAWPLLRGDIF